MNDGAIHIGLGDLDIRIHKTSPTTFDVVVGNCRTGLGVLMLSLEQEKSPYSFYKLVKFHAFVEGIHSIGYSNEQLQLLMNNPPKMEKDS